MKDDANLPEYGKKSPEVGPELGPFGFLVQAVLWPWKSHLILLHPASSFAKCRKSKVHFLGWPYRTIVKIQKNV
jgi:hypothetical protein